MSAWQKSRAWATNQDDCVLYISVWLPTETMIMARSLKNTFVACLHPRPPKKKPKLRRTLHDVWKTAINFPGPLVHRCEEGSNIFTGNECRSGCPEGRGCPVILLYWKVYIYIYTHTVYPLACNRHRWVRMLDVSIDFCVAQHFSLAQQLDLPILNMTKVPVAHGHSLGTDWPTCMISTNTEDNVDGKELWKKSC